MEEKDMKPILLEDLGMRYPTENSKRRYRYGLYQCQYCGKEFEAQVNNMKRGHYKSCGCLKVKHNLYYHPLYHTWYSMKDRCHNLKSQYYKDYGGRGIKVCDRWLNIEYFIEDMYPSYQEGLSIDRIDVNGDYKLDNCRWVTQNIQSRNTRDIKNTNTSGFRGVSYRKDRGTWSTKIVVDYKRVQLGCYSTALEAAKAYERYVRLNNLEHNFTPALTPEEIEALYEKES